MTHDIRKGKLVMLFLNKTQIINNQPKSNEDRRVR